MSATGKLSKGNKEVKDIEISQILKQPMLGLIKCEQLKDFSLLANQPDTILFKYNENQQILQVDALKDDRCVTFTGKPPKITELLKSWLSIEMGIPKEQVIMGSFNPL